MMRSKLSALLAATILLGILAGGCLEFGVPTQSDLRNERDPMIQAAGASAEAADRQRRANEIRLRAMNESNPARMDEAIQLRPYEYYFRLSKAALQIENGQSSGGSIAQAWYVVEQRQAQGTLQQSPYDAFIYSYASALSDHLHRMRENGKSQTPGYGRVLSEYCSLIYEESLGIVEDCPR